MQIPVELNFLTLPGFDCDSESPAAHAFEDLVTLPELSPFECELGSRGAFTSLKSAELRVLETSIPHLQSKLIALDAPVRVKRVQLLDQSKAGSLTTNLVIASPQVWVRAADDFSLAVNVVPLAISARIRRRFSFGPPRPDPANLFSSLPPRPREGSKLPRVEKPAPPPEADLEERLRWILTPPINELLSDPQLALPQDPYPYQMQGIAWLLERETALLADEMGLGKTMQAIVAARLLWKLKRIERVLIVCPKMLVANWLTELRKWWASLVPHNVKVIDSDPQYYLRLGTPNMTLKIINYERLAREVDWLKSARFSHDLIILDEGQRIKNPESKTARAVKRLKSPRRWVLTGTPLENRIEDVISIFEFIHPELSLPQNPDGVRKQIRPYMLRRRTDEVLKELPEIVPQDVEVELLEAQRNQYDRAEREGVITLNERGDTITIQHVFALISRLMQICNFCPQTGESIKIERLKEDLEEVVDSGRKALVFSRFVSNDFGLRRVAANLNGLCPVYELHGQVPPARREANISSFTNGAGSATMLLNYSVGGLGLNLQAANYVFLFDRWWNPAVEDQAIKRAHRIGQQSKVIVRRFMCRDTIEERIVTRLREKRRLFAHVIDEGRLTAADLGLSEEEVFSLFADLKARPRRKTQKPSLARLILDNVTPDQFEELVARIYEAKEYTVTRRGGPYDQGIDLLAEKMTQPSLELVAIQCKHVSDTIGVALLRELWGVLGNDPRLTRGDFVTSNRFSPSAMDFARGKRITLIDRDALCRLAHETGVAEIIAKQADSFNR